MQECFRKYPEIYGAELSDDELAEDSVDGAAQPPVPEEYQVAREDVQAPASEESTPRENSVSSAKAVDNPIPAKWEDATAANDEVAKAEKDAERESKPEEKDSKKDSKPEGEKKE